MEHSVLVIRDQTLTPPQVLAAVELFGPVFHQHNTRFALPECPQIHYISNQDSFPDGTRYIPGEGWHTDHSNDTRPPKATVLHAVTLPDQGGDTQFANMAAAYAALPAAMQDRMAGLIAIHVYQSSHSARKLMGLSDVNKERVPNAVLHPIVRTHPENGRKSIYINPIRIEGIVGLDHKEALPLLDELLEHATQEAIPVPPRMAAGRPGDVGQPLPAAQGERRLRHGPDAVLVSRHAARRRAAIVGSGQPGYRFARRKLVAAHGPAAMSRFGLTHTMPAASPLLPLRNGRHPEPINLREIEPEMFAQQRAQRPPVGQFNTARLCALG